MLALALKYWKESLLGALAIILLISLVYVRSLRSANEALSIQTEAQASVILAQEESLKANKAALLEREKTVSSLEREKLQAHQALAKAVEEDKKACEWSRELVPDSVLEAIGCAK